MKTSSLDLAKLSHTDFIVRREWCFCKFLLEYTDKKKYIYQFEHCIIRISLAYRSSAIAEKTLRLKLNTLTSNKRTEPQSYQHICYLNLIFFTSALVAVHFLSALTNITRYWGEGAYVFRIFSGRSMGKQTAKRGRTATNMLVRANYNTRQWWCVEKTKKKKK